MEVKKSNFNLQLNTISQSDDFTLLNATFVIHDFDKSGNNQILVKDVALDAAFTLKNKPIVAKYFADTSSTDALGSHEQYLGVNRYGEKSIMMDTVPIGVITTEGYLLTISENNEEKEVLAVDAVLWRARYSDVCDLLLEWYQRGVRILTSVEYLYKNFSFRDGVEYIESPIYYDGHCVLNSEVRGEHDIVLPSYESSHLISFNELKEFNRLVAQAISKNKEGETMDFFKKICELSHDDIRSKLYNEMSTKLSQEEYDHSWIVDVFESYFIYNQWQDGSKYYQVNYTKNDDSVTADFETKVEVMEERKWVKVTEVDTLQTQLNEANTKIMEMESQVNSLTSTLETVEADKEKVFNQFTDATEKLVSLNAIMEELKPYKEKYEENQFEQALNEKIAFYNEKFEAVDAIEKFNSEEVQNLIKLSVNSSVEGKEAMLQLNSILVEMVKPTKKHEETGIREFASKRENLIPTSNDFDSRYSI